MSFLTNMIKELRERKLWPIAIVLIIALVAVPVLLSKKASTNLVTPPAGGVPYSTGTTLPAISVETAAGSSKLPGRGRNPFTPQDAGTTSTATSTTPTTSTPSSGTSTTGTGTTTPSTSTSGAGSSTSSGGSTATTPAATTPSTPPTTSPSKPSKPKPAPSGLSAKQTYDVSLAITAQDGGLNTVDPLERLSVLPSLQKPLLVELGVLQGGKQVLFAVEPGAAVGGHGTCTPGPIDCEVLSLAAGQTEAVSQQTAKGTTLVAEFSVNSISATDHPSVAAADQARRTASDAGRQLIANSPLSTGSLFQYDPTVGAVVDLRNLTVGGN